MVTENVNIRFVETGARVVKRRIDEIGKAANSATRGIFLLQRAIFVLGGAGLARGLQQYADALTNMENRLKLTTDSTAQLEAVQSQLFDVARRSRSDLTNTADIYNRIALSAKNLGAGQKQILNVTETLQKAAILSGASAREANNALIQLGQGIASDRLSGDELRSVLEQLPAVADIIIDYLNKTGQFGEVTRGTLRQLGKEGKLTSEIIFRAIESSKSNIDRLFAETNPTIEQSFNVAKTNILEFIDTFDDATNASAKIANLIIKLSENFDILVGTISLVALGFAGLFTAKVLDSVSAFITRVEIAGGALARLRRIQAASAASQAASTAAILTEAKAREVNLRVMQARIEAQLRSAQQEYAEAAASFQNGRARDVNTKKFISATVARERLTAASIRLANAERLNIAITSKLAQSRAAATAAETAAAAAAARSAAAQAAQAGWLARLSAAFPLLAGAARMAAGAIAAVGAAAASNPLGAFIAMIAVAITSLLTFGDRIKVTEDGVVSLRDAAIGGFKVILDAISPVTNFLKTSFSRALDFIKGIFSVVFSTIGKIVTKSVFFIIDAFTLIPRMIAGVVAGLIAIWDNLPKAIGLVVDRITDFFATGFENITNIGVQAVNKIISSFNSLADTKVGSFLNLSKIEEKGPVTLDNLRTNFGEGGKEVGEAFIEAFNKTVEGGRIENVLKRFSDASIERARKDIEKRKIEEGKITDKEIAAPSIGAEGSGGGGGSSSSKDFASEIAQLKDKIDLEKQYGLQKETLNNILQIENSLKRELTQTESEQVANATRLLEISKIQGEVLQGILGPQETFRLTQEALNELLQQGIITLDKYNAKLRETQIAADKASETLSGGFRSAIASSLQTVGQFGESLGETIVNAANSAADAIVEFAKTGKLNIREFFRDLFAQLLKLAAQRLLLQFISGFMGIPGGGFNQGGSILPSFATGGSIMPTGPGSTDTQLVAFNKRPDERVDILTPGQQAEQKKAMVSQPPIVNTVTNVAAVLSPSDIVGAFDEEGDTVVVRILQRNASTVRSILNG